MSKLVIEHTRTKLRVRLGTNWEGAAVALLLAVSMFLRALTPLVQTFA